MSVVLAVGGDPVVLERVMSAARGLSALLEASVESLPGPPPSAAPVAIDAVAQRAGSTDVVAVAMSAQAGRAGGASADAALGAGGRLLEKPLLAVPVSSAPSGEPFRTVLAALDGTEACSHTVHPFLQSARRRGARLAAVHVLTPAAAPVFSEQPQYEADLYAREFASRHVDGPRAGTRLELRVGEIADEVVRAAGDVAADLLVLRARRVASEKAIVHEVFARSPVPVLLLGGP